MSSKIKQFKKVKHIIEQFLTQDARTRDSDSLLIARVWYMQLGEDYSKTISAFDFLKLMSEGALINSENIRRVRCKLQEQNIALRGETYKKRHQLGEELSITIHKNL